MTAMHEHRVRTAILLGALEEIPADATPAEQQAAADALTDHEVETASIRLLNAMGWPGYYTPAAA